MRPLFNFMRITSSLSIRPFIQPIDPVSQTPVRLIVNAAGIETTEV
jgi:hypothetical protein